MEQKNDGLVLREKLEKHRMETYKKKHEKKEQDAAIRKEQLLKDYSKLDRWYQHKILPSVQKYGEYLLHIPSFNDYFGTEFSYREVWYYFQTTKGFFTSPSETSGYDLVISIKGLADSEENFFESELPTATGKNGYHEYKALLPNIDEESV